MFNGRHLGSLEECAVQEYINCIQTKERDSENSEDIVSDSIDFLLSRPSHGDHGSRSSSRAGPTTRREGGAYLCGFLHTELHVQLVEGGRWRRGGEGG